jgi:hypothetical protein
VIKSRGISVGHDLMISVRADSKTQYHPQPIVRSLPNSRDHSCIDFSARHAPYSLASSCRLC